MLLLKIRESKIVRMIVSLIFAIICGYLLTALLKMLVENGNFQENVLDFQGTLAFIKTTEYTNQILIAVVTGAIFVGMFSKINQPPRRYQVDSDFGVHGSSRFAKPEELIDGKAMTKKNKYKTKDPVKSLKSMDRGIIVGKVPKKDELFIIPHNTKIDNRNVFTVGSAGSGKGQAVVINNIINNDKESMIVTDPKGELYRFTADLKRDQGYKVYSIDFINFNDGGYNPLDYVFDDQDSQQVAKTIAKNSGKDLKEDFFHVEGQRLLTALITYCKYEYGDKANIPDHVLGMFHRINKDQYYLEELLENMDKDHPAYQLLQSTTIAEGKTKAGIDASFMQQVGIFTIGKVARMTRKSTFNFREFQEHKSILYVKIPMDENPFSPLTATFFDQLINVLYKYADQNNSVLKIPTMFILDEFANIGRIEKYPRVLATCRGLGMSMLTIVQDIGQLESLYGKELARSIISNHDTQIFLRTKDIETAKYFSQLSGETTARMNTKSTSIQGGIFSTHHSHSKSTQEQYVKKQLITAGELTNIDRNDSYVFVSGYYPLKVEKAWQFNIFGDLTTNYEQYKNELIKVLKWKPVQNHQETDDDVPVPKTDNTDKGSLLHNEQQEIEHTERTEQTSIKETKDIEIIQEIVSDEDTLFTMESDDEQLNELEEIINGFPEINKAYIAQNELAENLKATQSILENIDLIDEIIEPKEIEQEEEKLPM